jgi:ABC-type uncharacterized transport system permease subunit
MFLICGVSKAKIEIKIVKSSLIKLLRRPYNKEMHSFSINLTHRIKFFIVIFFIVTTLKNK